MLDRDFLRGFVKLYALWRGSKPDAYGMAIVREMHAVGFELSPGTLYPALQRLHAEGDIIWRRTAVAGRLRNSYRLTAKGKRELAEVTSRLRGIVQLVFERPPAMNPPRKKTR